MKPSPKWQRTLLSPVQIRQLCMMATQAFKAGQLRGDPRTEAGAEAYRKAGQQEAAQIDSLKQAHQGHYLALVGYWFTQIGNLEEAFYAILHAGDASEARRQMAWRLMGEISRLANGIKAQKGRIQIVLSDYEAAHEAWRYTQHIAKDKFNGRRIDDLDAQELEQLGYTVTNRASPMLGKGEDANRNKKQRLATQSRKAGKTAAQDPLEPFSREVETLPQTLQTARHEPVGSTGSRITP